MLTDKLKKTSKKHKGDPYLVIRWYWTNYFRKYWPLLLVGILFMSLEGSMLGLLSYSIKSMFDEVFIPSNQSALISVGFVIFLIFFLRSFAGLTQRLIVTWVGQKVEKLLQQNLLEKLLNLDLSFYDRASPGILIERMRVDTRLITNAAGTIFMTLVKDGIALLSLIAVTLYVDWKWTIIAFIGAPILIIPIFFLQKWIRKISGENRNIEADLSISLDEIFHGISILKLYSLQTYRLNAFKTLLEKVRKIKLKIEGGVASTPALIDFIAGIGFLGVMIFGGSQIVSGEKSIGDFMAFFTAMALIFEPLRRLSNVAGNFQVMLASAEKVHDLFEVKNPLSLSKNFKYINKKINFKEDIYFENVSLVYGNKHILNNISFSIPSGQLVALVGKSGAGKSSILKLISGILRPTSGRILIGGIDISYIDPIELRSKISIIVQENQLFDETIYENVKIGRLDATKEEILFACTLAYVNEFSDKLPEKLFTKVGPRGSSLSGGQRQRVNIARALIRNCPIFLLDEPTTALDSKSEGLLQKAFKEVTKNKTTLFISHRISSIKNANKILVLEGGKIVEEGMHNNLIKNKKLYYDLYNLQLIEGKLN
ncbi:MAG: ABC transporter ATP-binding protein [Paracoccaceae bacterium]